MTSAPLTSGHASAFFRDDELVIQSHPLLDGATPPRFGDAACWDLNGVVHKAPSHPAASMRVLFHDLDPTWNLMARELAMLWLNPRHRAVLAVGVHLRPDPLSPMTVAQRVAYLRPLAAFGAARGLPALRGWSDDDIKAYIAHRLQISDAASVTNHIHVVKALHRFRAVLTCGGLQRDPWPGISSYAVIGKPSVPELKTSAIPPEIWFPLIRNCWTYIDTFASDIQRADAFCDELRRRSVTGNGGEERFQGWLADPANRVPLRRSRPGEAAHATINVSLLSRMIGVPEHFFKNRAGAARLAAVERLVAAGRTQPGLLPDLAEVTRADGTRGPWHGSLGPRELGVEKVMIRNACLVFTAALSMMRESELRTITKDAVVEYYGSPAVRATKQKLDPSLPIKHWWITPPVARAIELAARLSHHEDLAFAAVHGQWAGESFASIAAIEDLVGHINRYRHISGLEEIPDGRITPHMFRRTMAMLTREFPGSEVAVGMQLKHVTTRALANRVTGSYMDNAPSWAKHFDAAIADRRFDRLAELFDADTRGKVIGFGPGADRMREAFAAVREQADQLRSTSQAQRGDIRVEHDLLRRTRISIRFGKLNHCTMNDNDPVGAKCLEDTVIPDGHRGPLLDRCQPGRCANSIIAPEHIPIWTAERSSLGRMLAAGKLAPNHKRGIEAELHEVDRVIKRCGE